MAGSELLASLLRSPRLARLWFGVQLPKLDADEHAFDVTSLALTRLLRPRISYGSNVLDLGTGSAAILGLWMWKRLGCRVTCVELDPIIAQRARESIALNGAPIEVLESDMFIGVERAFDTVVFNPPYVPTALGERRGLPQRTRSQWDGGADGTRVIDAFLVAYERQSLVDRALLGVNRRHVPRSTMEVRIAARVGLELREVATHPILPVDLYVLVRRKSPKASASSPVE